MKLCGVNMNSEFLRFYLETELYLQNSPMHMDVFIDFCKKRGIKIDKFKLEYLEKKTLFYPIFRATNIYNHISTLLKSYFSILIDWRIL
jgi:hypothetical protein